LRAWPWKRDEHARFAFETILQQLRESEAEQAKYVSDAKSMEFEWASAKAELAQAKGDLAAVEVCVCS
jgi:hypothetical protein